MTSIEIAEPADAPALLGMIVEHAAYEGDRAALTLKTLVALLESDERPSRILVARENGQILGYASLTFDFALWHGSVWGHLDCLYVREGWRSHGVGKQLLDAARLAAIEAEAHWMEWQTRDWNARAIAFYRREGATVEAKTRLRLAL